MKRFFLLRIVGLFFLISLAGVCMGENSPNFLAYVQGGGSSIVEIPGGEYEITIQDIIPYIYQKTGDNGFLVMDTWLLKYPYPLNGAIVFTDNGGESTCIMNIINISFSEENHDLTLSGAPIEYYEGNLLNSFAKESKPLDLNAMKNITQISLYLEVIKQAPSNFDYCFCCYWEIGLGKSISEAENECGADEYWNFNERCK